MARPYALIRAGFPYDRTIGEGRKLRLPLDVAIHKDGRIFALTNGSTYGKGFSGTISVINLEDEDLGSYGWQALEYPIVEGAFMWPVQAVFDADCRTLFISDAASHKISVLRPEGDYLGRWGEEGSAPGQLRKPSGIAVDLDDNILVADSANHRVQKFTRQGRFISSIGGLGTGDGEFNMPWGLHVDELGQIYVADWRNDRIQIFDRNGKFLWKFGRPGNGNGEFHRPAGIAVDKDGDIYVCDWGNNRVQLFTHEGRYIQKFLGDATMSKSVRRRLLQGMAKQARMRMDAVEVTEQEKLFNRPRSVRVDANGYMYVPDYEHWRIQIYRKEAYPLLEHQVAAPFKVPTINSN